MYLTKISKDKAINIYIYLLYEKFNVIFNYYNNAKYSQTLQYFVFSN